MFDPIYQKITFYSIFKQIFSENVKNFLNRCVWRRTQGLGRLALETLQTHLPRAEILQSPPPRGFHVPVNLVLGRK